MIRDGPASPPDTSVESVTTDEGIVLKTGTASTTWRTVGSTTNSVAGAGKGSPNNGT